MQKWEVWYIWCHDLPTQDNKYCICLCPNSWRFYFISSEPPRTRKAREFAIEVTPVEVRGLKWNSFIDTTSIIPLHPKDIEMAVAEPERNKGLISPTLKSRIREAVAGHGVLNADQESLINSN